MARFEAGNVAGWRHGLESERPVMREVLPEAERGVWDAAPVPPGTDGVLEAVIRTWWVMQYRVMVWQGQRERDRRRAWGPAEMERFMVLMERPARVFMKALEVKVRMAESEASAGRDEAIRDYLAQLTPEQLAGLGSGVAEVPVGVELGRLALSGGE